MNKIRLTKEELKTINKEIELTLKMIYLSGQLRKFLIILKLKRRN